MLNGKVTLISGGARGVGAAEARLFVELAARVVIGDVLDEVGEATAERLGSGATCCHLDVTDPGLGNRRSRPHRGVRPAQHPGQQRRHIPVGNSRDHAARLVRPPRRRQSDRNVPRHAGGRAGAPSWWRWGNREHRLGGRPHWARPGCSRTNVPKWAIRGMTKTAALELGPDRIRVNVVLPGSLDTEHDARPGDSGTRSVLRQPPGATPGTAR